MPSWLPALLYPSPPARGYWHPITSTLNWCEEDYVVSHYVAELVNTFTNLLFFVLAIRGIRNCVRYGHDRIFLISFIGYGIVGSGSFLFHMTLKYAMQLVDELSMIYTACFTCYATACHFRAGKFHPWLAAGLVALALFFTLYYHYLQDPEFHQNAYLLLTALVLGRSIWIMETNLRPRARTEAPGDPHGLTPALRTMWIMVATGLTTSLTGFGIWSLDNHYCTQLIRWRWELGLPWGVLLEGHGWWHLMTGVGAYYYIMWIIWLRYCLNGEHQKYTLWWPSMFFSLPDVVAVEDVDSRRNDAAMARKQK